MNLRKVKTFCNLYNFIEKGMMLKLTLHPSLVYVNKESQLKILEKFYTIFTVIFQNKSLKNEVVTKGAGYIIQYSGRNMYSLISFIS